MGDACQGWFVWKFHHGFPFRASTAANAPRYSRCFFDAGLLKSLSVDTLQTAGAEDKPLLGSKLSADSGAKARLGLASS
jgi:hypothetical protein